MYNENEFKLCSGSTSHHHSNLFPSKKKCRKTLGFSAHRSLINRHFGMRRHVLLQGRLIFIVYK